MPKLMSDSMDTMALTAAKGNFSFSTVKIEDLGATEYTLVTIALDKSGSVSGFKSDLLTALKSVVNSCKKSPRAENLLLRVIEFNHMIDEVHGFKLLNMIDVDNDYKEPYCDGQTALNDAVFSSVGATVIYAKKLMEQDFNVNGICFVITDGCENDSKTSTSMITALTSKAKIGEEIESLISILVGINTTDCQQALDDFRQAAGMSQYVDVGNATAQRLAKLAAFVSKSISSQSQALGSGSASQPLTF
jgi:hypothetical protein